MEVLVSVGGFPTDGDLEFTILLSDRVGLLVSRKARPSSMALSSTSSILASHTIIGTGDPMAVP